MLIKQIARTTQLSEEELRRIASNASTRYKIYEIPKRGQAGRKRQIAHPSRELKALQRWISRVIFDRLPVHYAATAYRKGSGIKENAERHRNSLYTNRYDFSNFFPSFHQNNVEGFIYNELAKVGQYLDEENLTFIGNIVCRHGRLSIGAPSSPIITNAMMFDFDQHLFDYCRSNDLIYTRYADDLFISSYERGKLNKLEPKIAAIKRDIPHLTLRLNRSKTAYLSKKYARRITGIIITPDHRLSIGRERKREIKSLVHRWIRSKLKPEELFYMRGLLAFARDIEPTFETSLREKYGNRVIDEILRNPVLEISPSDDFDFKLWSIDF
ncbi:MAG: retron St85 family RNA-directed DNA polymerase [Nisaea sp.]|uniref:retron St85 family RNA-directed DNA polymerase n=1 Tax=Alphaproteobacteria TaxID=28211 RepID=UPI00329A37E0